MGTINKVYRFSGANQTGYIYSEQSQSDNMKFIYHMITVEKGIPEILDVGNTIQTLQAGDIKLYQTTADGKEFDTFLKMKELAEKRSILNKKYPLNMRVALSKGHYRDIKPKSRT